MLTEVLRLDRQSLIWVNSHHHPALDVVLLPVSLAGECGALWVLVGLGLLIFAKGDARRTGLILLLAMLITDRLIAAPLAHWVHRTRPYVAIAGVRHLGIAWRGSSFPSGHAHSVCIAAILLASRWRRLRWPLILFALLTCYARPYLGLHYPLDVIVGVALGIPAGLVAASVNRRLARPGCPAR